MLSKRPISSDPLSVEGKTTESRVLGTELYSSELDPVECTAVQYRTGTIFRDALMMARASTEEMSRRWDVTRVCDVGQASRSKVRPTRQQASRLGYCPQRSPWRGGDILDLSEVGSALHPPSSRVVRLEFWLYPRRSLMAYHHPTVSSGSGLPDPDAVNPLPEEAREGNETEDDKPP